VEDQELRTADWIITRGGRCCFRWPRITSGAQVGYRLEPQPGGTRFTYDYTGFTGAGGVFMAKLLGHVRRKMLGTGLPPVLEDLDEDGTLGPGSTLRPKSLG